jgi:hypothetical protein
VTVGDGEVGQGRAAGFGDAQRVEGQQASKGVVVAAGEAGLGEERAELGTVQAEPGGLL